MRIPQLTVAAAAALLLTACGSSPLEGKTGPEVADAAADALEEAGAVHVAGTIEQDGEEGEVDLQLQGEDLSGSLTLGGMEVQLLGVGGEVFMQAPPEFWASFGMPEEAAAMFDGEWVTVPGEAMAEFAEFSLAGFVEQLRNPEDEVKEEVRSDEIDGTDVVVAEQEDGSELYVADEDPSYPLRITESGDSSSELTFSRFGEEEEISAPEDPLDLEEMMGGA